VQIDITEPGASIDSGVEIGDHKNLEVMSRFTSNCCPYSRSEPGAGKDRVIWHRKRNCLVAVVAGAVCRVARGIDEDELIDRWTHR
jgi:hypothetical protein